MLEALGILLGLDGDDRMEPTESKNETYARIVEGVRSIFPLHDPLILKIALIVLN